MMAAYVAALVTLGVLVCHRYNREWNYGFGLLFFAGLPFAGLPFAGLLEDGLVIALWGYNLGAIFLIGFTLFAFLLEYQLTGEWEAGV